MSNINNARFVDMGGGNIAEFISFQIQMGYNPTTQDVRVVFNGAPYILMGTTYQKIGEKQDILEANLTGLEAMRLIPQGVKDPVTGWDMSGLSIAGLVLAHKMAYDYFFNLRAGTPGYGSGASTVEGTDPQFPPSI